MKIGIMQPYFFPYIGYYQIISSVDKFVIYDNIKYTKKGWINRNVITSNFTDKMITLPLMKDSDNLNIVDRRLSNNWNNDKLKLLNVISSFYNKSPFFDEVFNLIKEIINYDNNNLFYFLLNSLKAINRYLDIKTELIISSKIDIDHSLKGKDKVLSICKKMKASKYYNPIGGKNLYEKEDFKNNSINLKFMKINDSINTFSIIDVMMKNDKKNINNMLSKFTLI